MRRSSSILSCSSFLSFAGEASTNAIAHNSLGYLLHAVRKDIDAAEQCYRDAIEADPKYAEAHNNLGTLLEEVQKDYAGAGTPYYW